MAEKTLISWTDKTFNVAWGCQKTSPGCAKCYADTLSTRYGFDIWGPKAPRRTFGDKHWHEPVRWNAQAEREGKRFKVFCSSMCDIFEDHPTIADELLKLWPLIRATPNLDWQLLTKRSERIKDNLPSDWGKHGYQNCWMGVSIENNDYVYRADDLRKVPAVIRFISYEPALGPVPDLNLKGIHWLIVGGESGPNWRPMDIQWARDIKARCEKAGTTYYHKQGNGIKSGMHVELDGKVEHNFPAVKRIPLTMFDE